MMHSTVKRYHLVLWQIQEQSGSAGLKSQFETKAEAVKAFDESRRDGRYREGVLFQWNKDGDNWEMIDRFQR